MAEQLTHQSVKLAAVRPSQVQVLPYPQKMNEKISLDLIKNLYYQQKLSVPEISEKLGLTPDTIYSLMKRYCLSRRTLSEANKVKYEKKPLSFKIKEKLNPEEEKLKIAGIMLYWAEGAKPQPIPNENRKKYIIDFANSDSRMIKLFLKFLRKICGIDEKRLRVKLYCYANQNVAILKKYWCQVIQIPKNQFLKPYIREDFSSAKMNKMRYGLIHIVYCDKKLFLKIQEWIESYLKENI